MSALLLKINTDLTGVEGQIVLKAKFLVLLVIKLFCDTLNRWREASNGPLQPRAVTFRFSRPRMLQFPTSKRDQV